MPPRQGGLWTCLRTLRKIPQQRDSIVPTTPFLTSAAELLRRYDVVLCDIWGVVHDGRTAYPEAGVALQTFREGGGTVVLVTNAPMTAAAIAPLLDDKKVRRAAWDAIIGSGDMALAQIAHGGYARVFGIGPRPRDASFFDGVPNLVADLDDADAIACTGLEHERRETAEDYRPLLQRGLERNLPFVCVNPDLAVHVGADLLPCAGAIAALYEAMGGEVFWCGKPHPLAYLTALEAAEGIRKRPVDKRRVIGIGDAVRTDLKSAANAGVDALFIAGGLHRDELIQDGILDQAATWALLDANEARPVAVMQKLVW